MIARRRPWYAGLTRTSKSALVALLALLALADGALAYSLLLGWDFAGSIFDAGEVTILSALTNDDQVESEPIGFDAGDDGRDPIGPADLTEPYGAPVVRDASNVQSCTAVLAGNDLTVTMGSTYDSTRCAIKARLRNASPRPVIYDGAEIVGPAPIDVVQDPFVGTCIASGAEPFVALELQSQPGAVPGTTWSAPSAGIELTFHDVAACP